MKIKSILISNWRSIKSLSIDAEKLMIIIGQNNHGKSNLLSALLFFFGEIKHQDLDFNIGSNSLFVEIEFSDLDQEDKNTFKKYVDVNGNIKVRKTAYMDGSFEYKGYTEIPLEEWLQEDKASSYTKRELASNLPFVSFLPSGKLSKQNIVDAQNQYIQANKETVKLKHDLETTNFMGLKSVAKGIFGDVYFIPALKEASEDFSSKDSSAFGKIYADIISSVSDQDSDWKITKERLMNLFCTLNKKDSEGNPNQKRPKQITDLEVSISNELSAWGTDVEIEVTPPDIGGMFKANTQVFINDGVRTDIRRKGHGLQRALIFALIKVIANRTKSEDDTSSSGRQPSKSKYFIFEEPELYLHPQAQREVFDSFIDLSEKNQVILCTHSSSLLDVKLYKSIYIATKDNDKEGTKIKNCSEDIFDEDARKNLNLSYWINPDRAELFFAKKVILLEGQTDKTIVPFLAKKLGIFRHDYTLIDCGSKGSIPAYIKLLNKFQIPYLAVFDKDHQLEKDQNAKAFADNQTNQILSLIDSKYGREVIFDNDIEEELGIVESSNKNKPYVALNFVSQNNFQIPDQLRIKITTIYS